MAKKNPCKTPRSKIRAALRQVWMRSRERANVLKQGNYSCQKCGVKQSKAKGKECSIEIHHDPPIDWIGIIDTIFERLLDSNQIPLCKQCHKDIHEADRNTKNRQKVQA